jgi:hypothetical protein
VEQNIVLGEEDALWMTCTQQCQEEYYVRGQRKNFKREAGERWMVYGPCEYIIPVGASRLGRKKALIQLESLRLYAVYV